MPSIHSTSQVDESATLGEDVEVGPFCRIGPGVRIGEGCRLISHVVIDGPETVIGERNTFHPFSVIGSDAQDRTYDEELTHLVVGDGNVFREGVTVNRGTEGGGAVTRIGDDNLLMSYVHIAHDCTLGSHNVLTSYVGLSGHVTIDDRVTMGGRSGVIQNHRVGSYAYVGGASVVDKDLPPYVAAYGDRAEIQGVNVVGMKRGGITREAIRSVKDAHQLYFRSDLSPEEALAEIEGRLGSVDEVRVFVDFVQSRGDRTA